MKLQVTNIGSQFIIEDGKYIEVCDRDEIAKHIGDFILCDFLEERKSQLVIKCDLELKDSKDANPIIPMPDEDYNIK